MPDDINLVAGLHQFEALADFEFLFRGVIDEAVDALVPPFDVLVEQLILFFELLNLVLFLDKRSNPPRSSQRDQRITSHRQKSQNIRDSDKRGFHATRAWKIIVTSLSGFVSEFFRMTEEIVILCTCSSEAEAETISLRLLEEHVAACVNVIPVSRSYYWWQGAIESGVEHLLLIKSSRSLFAAVQEIVRQVHSYEIPELLALPVLDGSPDYLKWFRSNLR